MKITLILLILLAALKTSGQCDSLQVGKTYDILGTSPENINPFQPAPIATITILKIEEGWVSYCWAHDYKKKDRFHFSRRCETLWKEVQWYKEYKEEKK